MDKNNTQNFITTMFWNFDNETTVSGKIGINIGYIQENIERPCHNYLRPEILNEEE